MPHARQTKLALAGTTSDRSMSYICEHQPHTTVTWPSHAMVSGSSPSHITDNGAVTAAHPGQNVYGGILTSPL
jgi:hypothetical protein